MAKTVRKDEPIEALLKEGRRFPPPKEFTKAARIKSPAIPRGEAESGQILGA
jgi:hypothetical protein